jgi:BCD family chlorophyll transporter-like MFS transporter
MLDMTTADKVGLFIGAWGIANAISRLVGTVLGGMVRDIVTQLTQNPVTGYVLVFGIEAALLGISLLLLSRIDVKAFQREANHPSLVERAAITSEV